MGESFDKFEAEAENVNTKRSKLNAKIMTKDDVVKIMTDFRRPFYDAREPLYKLRRGEEYDDAEKRLYELMGHSVGGEHILFYQQNQYLGDVKLRKKAAAALGIDDPNTEQDFFTGMLFDLIGNMKGYRSEFVAYLTEVLNGPLFDAYKLFRFYRLLGDVKTEKLRDDVLGAARGFASFYEEFNSASVYDDMPVSKTMCSSSENMYIIKLYMKDGIANRPRLSQYLKDINEFNYEEWDKLYAVDRLTRQFSKFTEHQGDWKKLVEDGRRLYAQLDGFTNNSPTAETYVEGFRAVIHILNDIFEQAQDFYKGFKESSDDEPFLIMHVPSELSQIINKYSLIPMKDPLEHGTQYSSLLADMKSRLISLANALLKNVP